VNVPPEATWLKVPTGSGLTWPDEFRPQQAKEPSVLTAQLWKKPEETWLKVPAGVSLTWWYKLKPQQAKVASVLRPHV
jgi:hypothetical protein